MLELSLGDACSQKTQNYDSMQLLSGYRPVSAGPILWWDLLLFIPPTQPQQSWGAKELRTHDAVYMGAHVLRVRSV